MIDPEDVDEVCSYDDLLVTTSSAGDLTLSCPTCGVLPIPRSGTTLSDLTNAGLDHLLQRHYDTLTLTSWRPADEQAAVEPRRSTDAGRRPAPERDEFTAADFESLIALLGPQGAAGDIEALVRRLADSTEDWVLAFHQQLMASVAALDTPDHAAQEVVDLDGGPRTAAGATATAFLHARVAVVAAGPEVYASVLAEPARLAGAWPLRSAQLLLDAPVAAFERITNRPWGAGRSAGDLFRAAVPGSASGSVPGRRPRRANVELMPMEPADT